MNSDPLFPHSLVNASGQITDLATRELFNNPGELAGNPVATYLDRLSPGSRHSTIYRLKKAAEILKPGPMRLAEFPWWKLEYSHMVALRRSLAERYYWDTANGILSAARNAMKECWRLGIMADEDYRRASSVDNLRGVRKMSGRNVFRHELAAMLDVCRVDRKIGGVRDAALIAVLYCTGLRRGDVSNLDFDDYDKQEGSIHVKRDKIHRQRIVFISNEGKAALDAWIAVRGGWSGPLFCRLFHSGRLAATRLQPVGIHYAVGRRARQARLEPVTPHDLRRSFITNLLSMGVDVFTVRDMAGHLHASSTAEYDHRGLVVLANASELVSLPYEGRKSPVAGPENILPGAARRLPEHIEKRRKKAREIAWSIGDVWVGQYGWQILDTMTQYGTITVIRRASENGSRKHASKFRISPIGLVTSPRYRNRFEDPALARMRERQYDALWRNMRSLVASGLVECATRDPQGGGKGKFYAGYRMTQLGKTVVRVARAARLRYKGFHIRRIRERLEMALEEMVIDD